MSHDARSALEAMIGRRLPGGCEDCDAFQTMTRCADGLYVLTVHHDDTCPWLTARATSRRPGGRL